MIRYRCNEQVEPPAPFLHISLRRPDGSGTAIDLPAQLDTAADRTVIPARVVEQLQLVRLREIPVAGFGGSVALLPTYLVQAAIHQLQPHAIEVIASPGESYVLLGRDLLNQFRVLLDGPNLLFEIG